MPEYLTPGVYLEETSFRARSIEGVPTSTFGMAGLTRYGPVPYQMDALGVTMVNKPTLVTSFTEFERAFGSLEDVGTGNDTRNYLAYAARSFFDNGGRRLYVSRVFPFTRDNNEFIVPDTDFAKLDIGNPVAATWRARWPGLAGQTVSVMVSYQRSKNLLGTVSGTATVRGVQPGALVELVADRTQIPKDTTAPVAANLRQVDRLGNGLGYVDPATGQVVAIADDGKQGACHLTLTVTVAMGDIRVDAYPGLELDARGLPLDAQHPRSIFRVLQAQQPTDDLSLVYLRATTPAPAPAPAAGAAPRPAAQPPSAASLLTALVGLLTPTYLTGGGEGTGLSTDGLDGLQGMASDVDNPKIAATGLAALAEIDDIAIVAMPDSVRLRDRSRAEGRRRLPDRALRAAALPDRDRRSADRTARCPRYGSSAASSTPSTRRCTTRGCRSSTRPAKNDPGAAAGHPGPAAVRRHGRESTRAATSSAACTRPPPTRSCSGITQLMQNVTFDRSRC